MTQGAERDAFIASTVQRQRLALGLSQAELGAAMREKGWKWNQTTIWSIEQNNRQVRLAEAVDLAELLGTSIEQLFEKPLESALRSLTAKSREQSLAFSLAEGRFKATSERIRALWDLDQAQAGVDVEWLDPENQVTVALLWMSGPQLESVLQQLGVGEECLGKVRAWLSPQKPVSDDQVRRAIWEGLQEALPHLKGHITPPDW